MKMLHRVLVLSSIGFGLGVIAGVMISAISATLAHNDGTLYLCSDEFAKAVGNPLTAFLIQALATGILGAVSVGGSAIYEVEKWSLVKVTLIHYVLAMTTFFVVAFSMKWFSIRDIETLIMFLAMTVMYFIIWLVNYCSYRAELRKINMELDELKSSERNVRDET